jgi:hypothetical protein
MQVFIKTFCHWSILNSISQIHTCTKANSTIISSPSVQQFNDHDEGVVTILADLNVYLYCLAANQYWKFIEELIL